MLMNPMIRMPAIFALHEDSYIEEDNALQMEIGCGPGQESEANK